MEYSAPEWKIKDIVERIRKIIESDDVVKARELATVLGKVAILDRAFGKIVRVGLRRCHHLLGGAVIVGGTIEKPNWEALVYLDKQAREELKLIKHHIENQNGYRVQNSLETMRIEARGRVLEVEDKPKLNEEEEYSVLVSDASDRQAFIYEANEFKVVEEFAFSEDERKMGSGRRELRAVLKMLEEKTQELKKCKKRIYWITDSQNMFYFLKRGSRKWDIQEDIIRIKKKEQELGISVIPIWQPRETEEIVWADLGSKGFRSTDEWGIDKGTFKEIQLELGVKATIDGFATSRNKKCDRFYSLYPQVGSLGVNFFAQDLQEEEVYWLCPPVSKVPEVIKKLNNSSCCVTAILAFPEWGSHPAMMAIQQHGIWIKKVESFVYKNPFYTRYSEASNMFRGKLKFRFLAVL